MRFVLYSIVGLVVILIGLFVTDKVMAEDYDDCAATFSTDKEAYQSGDTIKLTLTITTASKQPHEIKFYEKFDNLDFSSHFTRICYPENPKAGDCAFETGINTEQSSRPSSDLKEYRISEDKPFQKTFIGRIWFDKVSQRYRLKFPELGYICMFDKKEYDISKSYGFIGYLKDVRPAFGVSNPYIFIQHKGIKLLN